MNLSDITRMPAPEARHDAGAAPDAQALIAQLGGEVAGVLSSALERVAAFSAAGHISAAGLRALRDEIERARRTAIVGQQVMRLGHSALTHSPERLDLTALLREAVRVHGRDIAARGIELRQTFDTAEVRSDATLLFTLLQAVLYWSFEHAVSRIDLTLLRQQQWPERAAITVGFAHRPADQAADHHPGCGSGLETMSWRLVQQAARALDMVLQRHDGPGTTELSFEFVETLAPRLADPAPEEDAADSSLASLNSHAITGQHVLVIATRRETRNVVRTAVRRLGLRVQYVIGIHEARKLCHEGAPQVLIFEAALGGETMAQFHAELQQPGAPVACISIAEEGRAFEVLNAGERQISSVGRAALIDALPAALQFELSRQD